MLINKRKIIAFTSLFVFLLLALFFSYEHIRKIINEKRELYFLAGDAEWRWLDKDNKIQVIYNKLLGKSFLRKVYLDKGYAVYAYKSQDYSLNAMALFKGECVPGTEIETSQKYTNGKHKKLTCTDDGDSFVYSVLWPGTKYVRVWSENLDGFNIYVDFNDWDFNYLDKEITMKKAY